MSQSGSNILRVLPSTPEPELPESEKIKQTLRGVVNSRVIDLITLDASANRVVLQMVEDRPFGTEPEQLAQLEEKFNNYVDYILDGWLVRQYPQYKDLPVAIELLTATAPDETTQKMITEMSRFASRVALTFTTIIRN